jgi:hypothetical protein
MGYLFKDGLDMLWSKFSQTVCHEEDFEFEGEVFLSNFVNDLY